MSTVNFVPTFLHGLIDDAAIFPPGLMPLDQAVVAHREHRRSPHVDLVGPFVVDDERVSALGASAGSEPIQAAVVTTVSRVADILGQRTGTGVIITAIEARLDTDTGVASSDQIAVLAGLAATHPEVSFFIEAPRPADARWSDVAASVVGTAVQLKFRTGGAVAEAFPTVAEVAEWISTAVENGTPFKSTAGLHRAVRHTDPATGFEYHGYLNILVATARAVADGDVLGALGERDAETLAVEIRSLSIESLRAAREQFVSYGSCSIDEPLEDLTALGLIPADGPRLLVPDYTGEAVLHSWVESAEGSLYDLDNLPYGVFRTHDRDWRPGVRIGDQVLDLRAASRQQAEWAAVFASDSLDELIGAGPRVWKAARDWITVLLSDKNHAQPGILVPVDDVELRLPFTVADYVDFYASIDHATNVGRLFRPDGQALMPNWRHLPVSYHGRAGSVLVSGSDIVRPLGQRKPPTAAVPDFGESRQLDIEAELGFIVGRTTEHGTRVATTEFEDTVFGVVGLNDWSARDIQAWEYVPLGPHLGKSFATSVSAWITPLAALERARVSLPEQDPTPLEHLRVSGLAGFDIDVEVIVNGRTVSQPPYSCMYWAPSQMLAHLTSNGARLRVGDLFGSGTISGPEREQRGSLLELSWGGREPWRDGGPERAFLVDGDEVILRYTAPGARARIGLGDVRATIVSAR